MELVTRKLDGASVEMLHHGFDIAIIRVNGKQECVNVSTLNVHKRERPKKFKF